MKFLLLALFALTILLSLTLPATGQRVYIRHRRSAIEREGSPPKESKESTVVVASESKSDSSAAADLPDDLKSHVKDSEKDCKDFFEMDYNPQRDTFMFNGQIPNMFHPFGPNFGSNSSSTSTSGFGGQAGPHNIQNLFQQMFQQASQMFNRLPVPGAEGPALTEKYPDNYNGTTEEIVDIDGMKFVKKTKIINKVMDGIHVHLVSTSYVRKDEPEVGGEEEKKVEGEEKKPEEEKDIPIKETIAPKHAEETTKKSNDLTDGTVVAY